jgi:hypothetical protein
MKLFSSVRRLVVVLGVIAVLSGFVGRVSAQDEGKLDFNGKTNYGEVKLKTGFTPDPSKKDLTAGGDLKVTIKGVTGYCTRNPDYRFYFEAGTTFPVLSVYAESQADTVLFINAADGSWHAIDDRDGLNPRIDFRNPQSGRYEIWVATFGPNAAPATVLISEVKQN